MKPILLEMQAFGPYADKQTIDFTRLTKAGIFLIKGPTGSGKTTIFDAMMYALYGCSTNITPSKSGKGVGKSARDDLDQLRCTQTTDKLPTVVSFTFALSGHTYRFIRRLVPKIKNLSEEYQAGELDEDGNLVPFFENPKASLLNEKAQELIGLTSEQFRQVVLLPQGQFERFLVADSGAKEEILKLIFNTQRWEKYADQLVKNAAERREALTNEKKAIDQALAEEGLNSLEALAERLVQLDRLIETNLAQQKEYDAEAKQAELLRDIQLAEQFRPLHDLEQKSAELQSQEKVYAQKEAQYQRAEKAESLRAPIDQAERALKERSDRERQLQDKAQKVPVASKTLETARARLEIHNAQDPTAALQAQLGSFAEKRSVYLSIADLRMNHRDAEDTFTKAASRAKTADTAYTEAKTALAEISLRVESANAIAGEYRRRYYAEICGDLARALTEGTPCPVCGSTSHPQPARLSPDSISKTDMERAEAEAEQAKALQKQADDRRVAAEKTRDEANGKKQEAQSALDMAAAALNHAKASLLPKIPDLRALDEAVKKANAQLKAYREEGEALLKQVNDKLADLSRVQAELDSCRKELARASEAYEQSKAELDAALKEQGYENAASVKADLCSAKERARMSQEVIAYRKEVSMTGQALERVRKELEGLTEPDSSAFEARQKEIQETSEQFSRLDTEYRSQRKRLSEKHQRLEKKNSHYLANILQAEEDTKFAEKVHGRSGVGLHRFVQAIMFKQMLDEANRMLSKVHGGRYQLKQTFEKVSGNKRGLNLVAFDSRSPHKDGRNVELLSGGEKFLVSLALSIGISTVAQASGIRMETLFIDEGFGTLDDSSIHDALDILESVRKTSGTIGIISHVSLLEGSIPTHLEVVKTESGSSIKPV